MWINWLCTDTFCCICTQQMRCMEDNWRRQVHGDSPHTMETSDIGGGGGWVEMEHFAQVGISGEGQQEPTPSFTSTHTHTHERCKVLGRKRRYRLCFSFLICTWILSTTITPLKMVTKGVAWFDTSYNGDLNGKKSSNILEGNTYPQRS